MKPLFLIADDNAGKRDFLQMFVEKQMDTEILLAKTSEEAFEKIHEHVEIPFAFIDYEIPSKNGPAIIRELRSKHPRCKIALVTASDSVQYKQNAEEAGADAFICTTWPLDRTENALTNLLEEWKVEWENSGTL